MDPDRRKKPRQMKTSLKPKKEVVPKQEATPTPDDIDVNEQTQLFEELYPDFGQKLKQPDINQFELQKVRITIPKQEKKTSIKSISPLQNDVDNLQAPSSAPAKTVPALVYGKPKTQNQKLNIKVETIQNRRNYTIDKQAISDTILILSTHVAKNFSLKRSPVDCRYLGKIYAHESRPDCNNEIYTEVMKSIHTTISDIEKVCDQRHSQGLMQALIKAINSIFAIGSLSSKLPDACESLLILENQMFTLSQQTEKLIDEMTMIITKKTSCTEYQKGVVLETKKTEIDTTVIQMFKLLGQLHSMRKDIDQFCNQATGMNLNHVPSMFLVLHKVDTIDNIDDIDVITTMMSELDISDQDVEENSSTQSKPNFDVQ